MQTIIRKRFINCVNKKGFTVTNTSESSYVSMERRLEALRKEPATLTSTPVVQANPDAAPLDYSEGCLLIDLGKRNLDEACPDRQAERISVAIEVVQAGLDKLKAWARAKGVPTAELKTAENSNWVQSQSGL